jgi:hypothetical protein
MIYRNESDDRSEPLTGKAIKTINLIFQKILFSEKRITNLD